MKNGQRMKRLGVIIADDDASQLHLIESFLDSLGHYVVEKCVNGVVLVDACRRLTADLVITDIKMPRMEGFEAAEKVHLIKDLPFIFVTSLLVSDIHGQFTRLKASAISCMPKPLSEVSLEAAIMSAMTNFWAYQEIAQTQARYCVVQRAIKHVMEKQGMKKKREAYDFLRNINGASHFLAAQEYLANNGLDASLPDRITPP